MSSSRITDSPASGAWTGAIVVHITSSIDGSDQLAMFYVPPSDGPAPLLVALHMWSSGYDQEDGVVCLDECRKRAWAMIHPHFRGPNNNPQACGSDLAVQDVLDAVDYAKARSRIDDSRIYLAGGSGGGYMSLMIAARAPSIWAGVWAWVPISDLARWHEQCAKSGRHYAKDLEAVCGGPPGSAAADREYRKRSPLFYLDAAKGVPIDLNAGIHDGYTGSVPIDHTLDAFNTLALANGCPNDVVSREQIDEMVRERTIPESLEPEREAEPGRARAVLFRRSAGPARVTIFDGGHEIDVPAAIAWLAEQARRPDQPDQPM